MKRRGYSTLLFLWFAFGAAHADEATIPTGMLAETPATLRGIKEAPKFRGFIPRRVDHSQAYPPPGNQGKQSSCVAWAVAYASQSHLLGANNVKHQPLTFSPAFLYNMMNQNSACSPVRISEALTLASTAGALPLDQFPYRDDSCAQRPTTEQQRIAAAHRIPEDAWSRLTINPARGVAALDEIKAAVAAGDPVIVGVIVDEGFHAWQGGMFDRPREQGYGHALVVVGYDEERQAVKLLNSWGQDWGDDGYGWISYSAFLSRLEVAFKLSARTVRKPGTALPVFAETPAVAAPAHTVLTEGTLCGRIERRVEKETLILSGYFDNPQAKQALLKAATAENPGRKVDDRTQHRPWPQCELMETLDMLAIKTQGLSIESSSPRTNKSWVLSAGDALTFNVQAPEFASYLYVIYVQADGSAIHITHPTAADKTPPRALSRFGLDQGGRALYSISPPFGDEMLVAIASPTPLFGGDGPPDSMTDRRLLTDYRRLLTEARDQGARLAADVVFIRTQAE